MALRQRQAALAMAPARRAFTASAAVPAWLDAAALEPLQARFRRPPAYSYDDHAIGRRGAERADRLVPMVPPGGATLEVGAGDGMVSYHLTRRGFEATALDLSPALFDVRAGQAGVDFVTGDAAAMPFDDGRFDLVVSYNSFEHFGDPEQVMRELIRVTRPGGAIHLDFGPLYFSAYGLHGYRSVHVPYSHLLFERAVLEQYVAEHDLPPIPFESLNGWSVRRFRELWATHAAELSPVAYREIPQIAGRELIVEHPSCFRDETDSFDDLLIAIIRATFRVTERGADSTSARREGATAPAHSGPAASRRAARGSRRRGGESQG